MRVSSPTTTPSPALAAGSADSSGFLDEVDTGRLCRLHEPAVEGQEDILPRSAAQMQRIGKIHASLGKIEGGGQGRQ